MAMDLLKRLTQGMGMGKPEPGPQWRTPASLDRGPLGSARMALDGNGKGEAIWENHGELWTMPIGPHIAPALLRLPLGEGSTPRIALNREGRGIAIWQTGQEGERQLIGKILGSGEDMAHLIFRAEGTFQYLQAAVDRRGNAMVLWLLERNGQIEVMAQSFDIRSETWESEPTTLGLPSDLSAQPRIAMNHRGHAMVLWDLQDAHFEGLVASHYWSSERIWSDRPMPVVSHSAHHHQVAMDNQGNAVALWVHAPYGERNVLEASYYDAHQSEWSEPETLAVAQTLSPPRLVMAGNGEALAAWCQSEGHGVSRLFAKKFNKETWDIHGECLDQGQGPVREFAIALGSDGQAGLLAVHHGAEGEWVSVRLKQNYWSSPIVLAPPAHTTHRSPRLCLCPQGASALWIQGAGREKSLILTETR